MKPTTKSEHMLTLQDAAERLGVDVKTTRRWIARGVLPAYRLGDRVIRLKAEDVDAMLVPVTATRSSKRRRSA